MRLLINCILLHSVTECDYCLGFQIPRGNKQNREWLLRQLKASIHEQFQPVQVTNPVQTELG